MANVIRSKSLLAQYENRPEWLKCEDYDSLFDAGYYKNILDEYMVTGKIPEGGENALEDYLVDVMSNPFVRFSVLTDEVKARVFYDCTISFLQQIMVKHKFRMSCAQGQLKKMQAALQWSEHKKQNGFHRLLDEISDEVKEYGYDSAFYRSQFNEQHSFLDSNMWEKMIEDWADAFQRKKQKELENDIKQVEEKEKKRLQRSLNQIPDFLNQHNIETDVFLQAWGLMGGMWNSLIFEKYVQIVKVQKRYPQLEYISRKMGRIADDDNTESQSMSVGGLYKLEHSAKCDIQGVTVGQNLNSLLPSELAQCCDDELYDVFLLKYATHALQSFRHKSEVVKPLRNAAPIPARLKGPMIVCVDKSGSMRGEAEKVANSLLIKLLSIADREKRDLYIIAFSVDAQPFEARSNRAQLLEFFKNQSHGDTNATEMLKTVFRLLDANSRYMSADVLWVSDFKIPLTAKAYRKTLLEHRAEGTRFYGLKIGRFFSTDWTSYFDEIIEIDL